MASDCEENAPFGDSKGDFSFMIINSNYENMVGVNAYYHPDSIKVFNEQWELQLLVKEYNDYREDSLDAGWEFNFTFIDTAPAYVDFSQIDKTFYLYLNKSDLDTLRVKGENEIYLNGARPPQDLQSHNKPVWGPDYYFIKNP